MTARQETDIPDEPSIGDHGLIGDMRTAALVDRWGRINWLCWPRFDSPPLFRSLIDPGAGGCWQLAPDVPFRSSRRYLRNTNVLETTFSCRDGVATATDFMVAPSDERWGSQLVRVIQGRSGAVPVRMTLRASRGFDGGAAALRADQGAILISSPDGSAAVTASRAIEVTGDEARIATELRPGETLVAVLASRPVTAPLIEHGITARDATVRSWRDWIGRCTMPRSRPEAAARSALVLKLLQHEPTSTLVAAPTTSLPEHVGGPRNWDYRYTWLRDSSMMVLALQELGQHDEAMAYWDSLARMAERNGDDLSVAYTLEGDLVPEEQELAGLAGYRRSRPVRVGNAAARQRQHDVYGHVMEAAARCYHRMDMDIASPQGVLRNIADFAARRWNRPDDAIWEVRSGRDHHTYSYLMSWVALDRAVDLAGHHALDGDAATWATQRDAVRREILTRGWNADVGAFTAVLGGRELDASMLTVPLVGFLPPDDPRCRATRETVADRLGAGGLVRRYLFDDGFTEPEGAFLICTLWLADSYTVDDDPNRGEELLDRVLAVGNDLGLLAEQADPATGDPLGNFPQGLTHLGVIQSLSRLDATDWADGQR